MNIFQKIARTMIKKSFHLSVWTIEQFHDMTISEQKTKQLQDLPNGTIGKAIADCLLENKLRLVPNFESHDLKHVLLNYKMTPVDEIRMQAFMIGNGNYSVPSFAILTFGSILLPDEWSRLYKDFQLGRRSQPISEWSIEDCATQEITTLRQQVIGTKNIEKSLFSMQNFIKYASFATILAGIFGMLYCLPYLFSSNIADLVGAGFPFVAGAILTVGGLVALSNVSNQHLNSVG